MDNIIYSCTNELSEHDIKKVYEDAGWIGYTKDLPKLMNAIKSSLMIVSAWEGTKLVGLNRVLGDGITVIYIQDILVLNSYKRKGIGSNLLEYVLDKYKHIHQKVLLTDDNEETRGFYERNGFISCDKGDLVAFAKFD